MKPFVKNIDNFRIIIDKIINLIISVIFFIFAINESSGFISAQVKTRFIERGMLMFLLFGKLIFTFTIFVIKIFSDLKEAHLARKKKIADKKKLEDELALQKLKVD
jgi:phage regulator Rha-like protein